MDAAAEDWDNERVAELLATADASGDGKLQIGEFLQWIFAEDPKAIGLGHLAPLELACHKILW